MAAVCDKSSSTLRDDIKSGIARRNHHIESQLGFVLHRYAYRESSIIVEIFSRNYGRLALLAKGARRQNSVLRGVLQSFVPLSLSWIGRAELKTLSKVDWVGGVMPLSGNSLLSAFYLNELLLRFLPKEDPCPILFDAYTASITGLAENKAISKNLRRFERVLLRESGYGRVFFADEINIDDETEYVFDPQNGWKTLEQTDPCTWPRIYGYALKDVVVGKDDNVRSAAQNRNLMRFLLDYYLGGKVLETRRLFYHLKAQK